MAIYLVRRFETQSLGSSDEKTVIWTDKDSTFAQHYKGSLSFQHRDRLRLHVSNHEESMATLSQGRRSPCNVMTFNSMRDIDDF